MWLLRRTRYRTPCGSLICAVDRKVLRMCDFAPKNDMRLAIAELSAVFAMMRRDCEESFHAEDGGKMRPKRHRISRGCPRPGDCSGPGRNGTNEAGFRIAADVQIAPLKSPELLKKGFWCVGEGGEERACQRSEPPIRCTIRPSPARAPTAQTPRDLLVNHGLAPARRHV
jgi:hypothetical protein